ncbi:MAG TPA: RHS repeat-associated core domain-containing protein [Terriglobales bacterium]|nr:RHS repeat-associated core domain-containing protein [Terriglobales bacterium]
MGTPNESFAASTAASQISGFTFDAAGRLTSGSQAPAGARTLGWDPAGQLTSYSDGSESASFKYDPFGRRIEATVNGQTTYYLYGASDGGHPIAEKTGGAWYREAIMDGVRWGWLYQNGDGRFTLPDALGSTAVLAQDGTVEASRLYPFGEEAQATGAEYKWTNQIRDANGLDHFAFRTYSSNLARWLSPDPAGLAAVNPADPASWNRYAYVENTPLEFTDPLGLDGNGCNAGGTNPDGPVNCNIPTFSTTAWTCGISCDGFFGFLADAISVNPFPGLGPSISPVSPPPPPVSGGTGAPPSHPPPAASPQPPCDHAGGAPPPADYAAEGSAALALEITSASIPGSGSLAFNLTGVAMNGLNLVSFHRGGRLDAQVRYGGSQAYANYVFGAYMAAAGFSLSFTLSAANAYGALASRYPHHPPIYFDPVYSHIPKLNVASITAGFNAERDGSLCGPR